MPRRPEFEHLQSAGEAHQPEARELRRRERTGARAPRQEEGGECQRPG